MRRQNQWLALILALTVARGLAIAFEVPPWQAPDEPSHYGYAWAVLEGDTSAGPLDSELQRQREIIATLAETDFWTAVRAEAPSSLPESFAADPFLARSGVQAGDEPIGYYWLLSQIWRLIPDDDISGRLLAGRLLSLALLSAATLVAGLAARKIWPDAPGFWWALPAFVALVPGAAFMGSALNNDSLALLAGTIGVCLSLWITRRGSTIGRVALLILVAVIGTLSKKTDLFLWPLALATCVLAMGHPFRFAKAIRSSLHTSGGRAALTIAAVALVAASIWLVSPMADRPADWVPGGWSGVGGRWSAGGDSGLALRDKSVMRRSLLEQSLGKKQAWATWGHPIELYAEVRSEGEPVEVSLRLYDATEAVESICTAEQGWTPCHLSYSPASPSGALRAVLAVGAKGNTAVTGAVQWRNISLTAGEARDQNLLSNAAGQTPARRIYPLSLWIERLLQAPRGWVVALSRSEQWSPPALLRYAGLSGLAFASFWGNFGWLQAPLPVPIYGWLALLCCVAAFGLAKGSIESLAARRGTVGEWVQSESVRLIATTAVALILLQTALPMIGFTWQPQGRYLFPALAGFGVCMLEGLQDGLPSRLRRFAAPILLSSLLVANVLMAWVIHNRW